MKKLNLLTIAFILLFVTKGFAQDWNVIKPDAIAYYQGSDSIVLAIRIDSTSNYGDSIDYFNYHYIRPVGNINNNCYTIKGASWLGERVRYRNNGICTFYNYQNKPITINTKAQLGESWQLFTYPNGSYIVATVMQADSVSFLSLRDSVKTISLQLKNNAGINLTSTNTHDSIYIINNTKLKLSKNYCLINSLHFFQFPYVLKPGIYPETKYNKFIKLIGLSDPLIGYQNFNIQEIFNFDLGDEMHLDCINDFRYQGERPSYHVQDIKKIINKISSNNNDTLTYRIQRCWTMIDPFPSTSVIDSITEVYILNYYNSYPLNMQSFETYTTNSIDYYFLLQYRNKKNMNFVQDKFTKLDSVCFIKNQEVGPLISYLKGLGGPYYNYFYNLSQPPSQRKLVYYKKGTIEWGSPFDCQPVQIEDIKATNKINIYPNPASNIINIEFPQYNNQKYKISFCNLQGKILLQKTLLNSETIDISSFSEGVYILKIETNNFIETKKIIVVK